jgi:HEPN domain-containing protein
MNEKTKYWLEMAEYDFETARVMLQGRRFLYVGFMCHQTIEKILKAFYVCKLKENPPHTHNLTYLAQQTRVYDNMSEDQKSILDILEPLNVESRYPTQKEKLMQTLNYERCEGIVKKAEGLYQWIKNQL